MKKRYIFLAIVPIVLSLVLVFLPDKSNSIDAKRNQKSLKSAKYTGVTPNNLLLESVNSNRFIQPDELAKVIIGEDPSYLLVDLRDANQYEKFTLPGAINIPVDQIGSQTAKLKGANQIIVFCRSGARSGQAKAILESKGFTNVTNGGTWQNVKSYVK